MDIKDFSKRKHILDFLTAILERFQMHPSYAPSSGGSNRPLATMLNSLEHDQFIRILERLNKSHLLDEETWNIDEPHIQLIGNKVSIYDSTAQREELLRRKKQMQHTLIAHRPLKPDPLPRQEHSLQRKDRSDKLRTIGKERSPGATTNSSSIAVSSLAPLQPAPEVAKPLPEEQKKP